MMQGLTASSLISAWDVGFGRRPLDQAIALLWAAGVPGDIASLPLADRDRRLLALRQATFGDTISSITRCPKCDAEMDFELDAAVLAEALEVPSAEPLDDGEGSIALRPLNSHDLAAAAAVPEADVPALLRERLTGEGGDLSEDRRGEIEGLIEARASAGELNISLTCTDCAAAWREALDVAGHVWSEVDNAARGIMAEVAEIAAAFAWAETDILAMSEARRRAYLSLARGA